MSRGVLERRRDCRAIIEARMPAGRWGRPGGDPAVQIDQGRAQQRAVVDRVGRVLSQCVISGPRIGELQSARAMLRARQVIEAHGFRRRQIVLAIQVRMRERGMATPVL